MRAIQYDAYGDLDQLVLRETPPPSRGRNEVRVGIIASALNPKDSFVRKGRYRILSGNTFPKTGGIDFAGRTIEGGALQPGTLVFGALHEWRFLRGTMAEQVVVKPKELATLPSGVDPFDAASVSLVGLTALQALRDLIEIKPGARLLINGASGGVGTAAIQIANALGARVTTLSSASNQEFCAELGAIETLDYASECRPSGPRYDAIFDVFGNFTRERLRDWLAPNGRFVSTVPNRSRLLGEVWARISRRGRKRLVVVKPNRADLDQLGAWLADGTLQAQIERKVPLENVRDGMRHLESKRTRGKIVVDCRPPG